LIESSGNDPLSHTTVQEFSQDFSHDSSQEKGMTFYYLYLVPFFISFSSFFQNRDLFGKFEESKEK